MLHRLFLAGKGGHRALVIPGKARGGLCRVGRRLCRAPAKRMKRSLAGLDLPDEIAAIVFEKNFHLRIQRDPRTRYAPFHRREGSDDKKMHESHSQY